MPEVEIPNPKELEEIKNRGFTRRVAIHAVGREPQVAEFRRNVLAVPGHDSGTTRHGFHLALWRPTIARVLARFTATHAS